MLRLMSLRACVMMSDTFTPSDLCWSSKGNA